MLYLSGERKRGRREAGSGLQTCVSFCGEVGLSYHGLIQTREKKVNTVNDSIFVIIQDYYSVSTSYLYNSSHHCVSSFFYASPLPT